MFSITPKRKWRIHSLFVLINTPFISTLLNTQSWRKLSLFSLFICLDKYTFHLDTFWTPILKKINVTFIDYVYLGKYCFNFNTFRKKTSNFEVLKKINVTFIAYVYLGKYCFNFNTFRKKKLEFWSKRTFPSFFIPDSVNKAAVSIHFGTYLIFWKNQRFMHCLFLFW